MNKETKQKYISLLIKSLTEDVDKWKYEYGLRYSHFSIHYEKNNINLIILYYPQYNEISIYNCELCDTIFDYNYKFYNKQSRYIFSLIENMIKEFGKDEVILNSKIIINNFI